MPRTLIVRKQKSEVRSQEVRVRRQKSVPKVAVGILRTRVPVCDLESAN
jgi:membrane protein CcdC involved in cytochrome C biogenesis